MRRIDPTTGINIVGMTRDTPIPQQLDKFWSSQENKQNLQLLVRDTICNGHYANTTIIASSVVSDDEVLPAKANGGAEIPELLNWTEEADSRLVLHVEWVVRVKQCQRVVVLSNDTDTFALLLHYAPYLQTQGLKELWQHYGTGEKRHMLPLQQAVSQLGAPVVKTVIKAYILTGDDCMRKVGTKHAAMTCYPVQYLTNFGETDTLSDQDVVLADMYLVRVWARARSTTTAHTFNQLRVEQYTSSRAGIDALPPTSSEIRGHIHRGAFLVNRACRLLATDNEREASLEPGEHKWEEHFGTLLHTKCMKRLPQNVVAIGRCAGKCDTQRYGCRSAGVTCVIFCHGKKDN